MQRIGVPLPPELEYVAAFIRDRIRRLHDADREAGMETLQMIIIAAIGTVIAVAAMAFIAAKVQSWESKIK